MWTDEEILIMGTNLGWSNLYNAILVSNRVRPAFLIMPCDFCEVDASGPMTSDILRHLAIYFPLIIQSSALQGILCSLDTDFSGITISGREMGKILGYPSSYSDDIACITEPTSRVALYFDSTPLFACIAKDSAWGIESPQYEEIATKATAAFSKDLNNPCQCTVKRTAMVTIDTLLMYVKERVEPSQEIIGEMKNLLWNHGLDEVAEQFPFSFTNDFHRGILTAILTYCNGPPVSAFYPLQYHSRKEIKEVDRLNELWALDLVKALLTH